MKKTYLTLIGFSLLSISGFSQTVDESEIVISEENLISLISRIKAKRIENLSNQANIQQVSATQPNFYTKNFNVNTPNYDPTLLRLDAISSDLLKLQYEMKYTNALLGNSSKTIERNDLIVAGRAAQTPVGNPILTPNNNNAAFANRDLIYQLQRKVDSLELASIYAQTVAIQKDNLTSTTTKVEPKTTSTKTNAVLKTKPVAVPTKIELTDFEYQKQLQNNQKEYVDLQKNYEALVLQLKNQNSSTKDTLVINHKEVSDFAALYSKYGNFKNNVFFDNNSTNLNATEFEKLKIITQIIKSSERVDVYLKGFASNKGSASLNQKLSLDRTESVKEYLILNGIHPSRILSQFHGIDYQASKEQNARRVDISFIIRK